MKKHLHRKDNGARAPSSTAAEILEATRGLYEAMHRFDGAVAGSLEIHRSELRCLNALERGPLKPTEIGQRLGLTSGAVTALVNRLVTLRLVERTADAADRRSNSVALTPLAFARVDSAYSALGAAIGSALSSHDAAARAVLPRALTALGEGFDAAVSVQRGDKKGGALAESEMPPLPRRRAKRVRRRV